MTTGSKSNVKYGNGQTFEDAYKNVKQTSKGEVDLQINRQRDRHTNTQTHVYEHTRTDRTRHIKRCTYKVPKMLLLSIRIPWTRVQARFRTSNCQL
jgi:hypothetical protein